MAPGDSVVVQPLEFTAIRVEKPPNLTATNKNQLSMVSGFADEHPANPVISIFKGAANDSPSPGGEGRPSSVAILRRVEGEGGCPPCLPDVVAATEESAFTTRHPIKASKN